MDMVSVRAIQEYKRRHLPVLERLALAASRQWLAFWMIPRFSVLTGFWRLMPLTNLISLDRCFLPLAYIDLIPQVFAAFQGPFKYLGGGCKCSLNYLFHSMMEPVVLFDSTILVGRLLQSAGCGQSGHMLRTRGSFGGDGIDREGEFTRDSGGLIAGLEAAADGIELGADFGAERLHGSNCGDSDEGRNESIFDQVLAGVVTEESLEGVHGS
jgi:hypothetical protein